MPIAVPSLGPNGKLQRNRKEQIPAEASAGISLVLVPEDPA